MAEDIKRATRAGLRGAPKALRTKFHALTGNQVQIMLNSGFSKKEIREFDQNTSTDFESRYFQTMIRSRRRYVNALLANDWSPQEIRRKIQSWYRKREKSSPWDFFRLEYAAVSQRPTLTGTKFADFLKNRRDMSAHFGRAYGRVQAVKPQYLRGLKGLPRRPQR
jgi:hypothetical protein